MPAASLLQLWVVTWATISLLASQRTSATGNRNSTKKINVHIIAHSHDDVGWLKTVDEYYYGAKQSTALGAVQFILDTVVSELLNDPKKRFVYVEMAFLYRWWREQLESTRNAVRKLVSEGRLQFVNGGWCMNDEATTHYSGIIDQMALGHGFILSEFGAAARPRVAWQIDPFGHSAGQAAIFADMAFDGLFMSRVDYEDKSLRLKQSRLEMVWRGSPKNQGESSDLFTGLFYNHYAPPKQFCFDPRCSDQVVVRDDRNLDEINIDTLVEEFVEMAQSVADSYRTNNVMIPMGDDFNYASARQNFKNIDKMLEHLADDGRINAFYSTPLQYLEVVHEAGLEWELKTDDFLPYADHPHSYWTGFYTSRPALKRYVRTQNNLLQTCKQIEAIAPPDASSAPASAALRQAVALTQHHDAITGTERQLVAYDYAKRLSEGSVRCELFLQDWAAAAAGTTQATYFLCNLLNISVCPKLVDQDAFSVFLYNPLLVPRITFVHLPVSHELFTVSGSALHQVMPISEATAHVRGNRGFATHELVLGVSLPPASSEVVLVKPTSHDQTMHKEEANLSANAGGKLGLHNNYLQVTFSPLTRRMSQLQRLDTQQTLDIDQQFFWYQAFNSSDGHGQPSGAYIFRPANNTPFPVNDENNCAEVLSVELGELVQEVRLKFSPWVYQTVRLYKDQKFVELEYSIGPIPVDDNKGKEVISSFRTSLSSNATFFTDANGREMKVRLRFVTQTQHDIAMLQLTSLKEAQTVW